jgi:hypothetical protein
MKNGPIQVLFLTTGAVGGLLLGSLLALGLAVMPPLQFEVTTGTVLAIGLGVVEFVAVLLALRYAVRRWPELDVRPDLAAHWGITGAQLSIGASLRRGRLFWIGFVGTAIAAPPCSGSQSPPCSALRWRPSADS